MPPPAPRWMTRVLALAGVYNLAWGAWAILFPTLSFDLSGMRDPDRPLLYPQLWQCIGMIVGVYGVGYLLAARDPLRHWPIVLVGLLGKVFGPVGLLFGVLTGQSRPEGLLTIIPNDLIWWVPFGLILKRAWDEHLDDGELPPAESLDAILASARPAGESRTLLELSSDGPLLVLFLRHFGCIYCREAVADLAAERKRLEADGVRLAVVHMSSSDEGREFLDDRGLVGVVQFSDPDARLYRAFGLRRGGLRQVFAWKSVARFWDARFRDGHRLGRIRGDALRMPGAFVLENGRITREFRAETSADRTDFAALATCAVPVK